MELVEMESVFVILVFLENIALEFIRIVWIIVLRFIMDYAEMINVIVEQDMKVLIVQEDQNVRMIVI